MSKYTSDTDFEKLLEEALYTPDPSDQFVDGLRSKLNIKANKMKAEPQKVPLKRLWVLAPGILIILILMIAVLSSPRMVEAMRRLLEYIPGIGLVENDGSLRVLAEPVSQTRDGITISVTEAAVSPEKTIIVYRVENVPPGKLYPAEGVVCAAIPELRLPDGTRLQSGSGGGGGGRTGYERRFFYPPIPADVDKAWLVLPCIQDTALGALPENWEFPLRFISAPPGIKTTPVFEITPSLAADSGAESISEQPLSITNVIVTGESYILIGEFDPPAPIQAGDWFSVGTVVGVTDAAGQELPFEIPRDIDLPLPASPHTEVWAAKFSKEITPPLTITYSNQYILPAYPAEVYEFEFDSGSNPKAGQSWELNKEIQWSDHTFRLVSISAFDDGYNFNFATSDETLASFLVGIDGYTPFGGGGGGGWSSAPDRERTWSQGVNFTEMPAGKLRIVFSNLLVKGETKNWTLEWHP